MTYEIPSGAYPRNWISPPDPLPEREVQVYLNCWVTMRFEESMDPYDEDQVREIATEHLRAIGDQLTERGNFFHLSFHDIEMEDYEICPLPVDERESA